MLKSIRRTMAVLPGALLIATVLALLIPNANAQAIYRSVGPDGRPVFSDKAPASADKGVPLRADGRSAGEAGGDSLPFELRQIANRYPVTLYISQNCEPCSAGRSLLSNRGIPFNERSISTAQDIDALQNLSGGGSVPFLTIGAQNIKGFDPAEWTGFLDAAGYPTASRLPTGYRNPPATPLVAKTIAPTAADKAPEAAAPAPIRPAANPQNPSGIIF